MDTATDRCALIARHLGCSGPRTGTAAADLRARFAALISGDPDAPDALCLADLPDAERRELVAELLCGLSAQI